MNYISSHSVIIQWAKSLSIARPSSLMLYPSFLSLLFLNFSNFIYLFRAHSLPSVWNNSEWKTVGLPWRCLDVTEVWINYLILLSVPMRAKWTDSNSWILREHVSEYMIGYFREVVVALLSFPQVFTLFAFIGLKRKEMLEYSCA